MASVNTFYTNSEDAFTHKVTEVAIRTSEEDLDKVYEIQKSIDWIKEHGFERVALQFPDELMPNAVSVTNRLQEAVGFSATVFILGDTSYGSCCVDEVAAQHYGANAIIHYGRSCLSQPGKMPTLFVFTKQALDIGDCADQVKVLIPDTTTDLILLYDTVYSYACDELESVFTKTYSNIVVSKLTLNLGTNKLNVSKDHTVVQKCGRTIVIPQEKGLRDFTVIFIGAESLTLTNLFYNFQPRELYSYNPLTKHFRKESVNVNKLLMKRYFLIEKAKDANIIGILVGTLGVANYVDILNRLKQMIKKAGKKSYVFIVGKINVAKLANFMEIDIFVLIACSENTLLDSSEFYKPVITPYEMEIACSLREWTGDYPTDYNTLLIGGSNYVEMPDHIDQDETDISLVTGKLRHVRTPDNNIETGTALISRSDALKVATQAQTADQDEIDISLVSGKLRHIGTSDNNIETGTALISRSDALQVATQAQTAGQFLEMRSWKGLEQNLGETPVTKAIEGQRGIAMGYKNETSKD